jgi:DNA polymerase-3 subunit epsilon
MILLSFDLETTGLDFQKDRVIEVGAILYSTTQKKCLESMGYLVKSDGVPVSAEITQLTGITQGAVDKFGFTPTDALEIVQEMMEEADAIIGQNVLRFDKPMVEPWFNRLHMKMPQKLWIDTRTDLPGIEGKHLGYMCADNGFLNLFPHSALSDCQSVLKLVSMCSIADVVARAESPTVILKAHVSYETNKLAKARKYSWNPENKLWWKVVKQMDLEKETSHQEFDVSFVTDIPIEKLWHS